MRALIGLREHLRYNSQFYQLRLGQKTWQLAEIYRPSTQVDIVEANVINQPCHIWERRQDLLGHQFVVSYRNHIPLHYDSKVHDERYNRQDSYHLRFADGRKMSGIRVEILHMLARRLNFTVKFTDAKEYTGHYGVWKNGRWNGMLGWFRRLPLTFFLSI